MSDRQPRIGDEEARLLWRRAAELQAAAERHTGQALARANEPGMSLQEVAAAADSAGIDADYVRIAHAERQLPDAEEIRPDQAALRWLRPLIGSDADAFEVTRVINAAPTRVLDAVRAVFAEPAYGLVPELVLGQPATDGVLVYRITKTKDAATFHEATNWADARVLIVIVRPEREGARVRIRVPLFRRSLNVGVFGVFGGLAGYGGGAAGWAIGAALLPVAPAALFAATAAIGAAAGATLGAAAYRSIYWWATNGGRSAVQSLLNAVVLRAEATSVAPPTPQS